MLLCTHAAAGALLGRYLPHRAAAVVLGVFSHAALDLIRHEDNGGADPRNASVLTCVLDVTFACAGIAGLLLSGGLSRAALGALSGILPDLELLLPCNQCLVADSRLVFPSHAVEKLHSVVAPVEVSLRMQLLFAIVLWIVAFGPGRLGREA